MATIDELLARYDRWANQREIYSELDGELNGPTASEWEGSDDDAVDLLHSLVNALRADIP